MSTKLSVRMIIALVLIGLVGIPACAKREPTADTHPRISDIVASLEHQRNMPNKVQAKATMIWKRAWAKRVEGCAVKPGVGPSTKEPERCTVKTDVGFSAKEMDIFFARSGDKLRCDVTMKSPDSDPQITKYIVDPRKEVEAMLFKAGNATVFIRKRIAERPSRFAVIGEMQMALCSPYSLLAQPLAELIEGEDATFEIVREETYNGSLCLMLHGETAEAGLRKARLRAPDVKSATCDIWVDLEKNFSVVQWKSRVEGFYYMEQATELGKNGEIWFPKRLKKKQYSLAGGKNELVSETSLEVYELTVGQEVDPSLFTLAGLGLPHGTRVHDQITETKYRWPPDVSKIDQPMQAE